MEKENLINAIRENAKYFIDEVGECFPFAICVNDQEELVPVYLNEEEEFPDFESMIEELKFCIEKAIEENSFSCGAIAYDEVLEKNGSDQDVVRIVYFVEGKQPVPYDFPYFMEKGKAVFL